MGKTWKYMFHAELGWNGAITKNNQPDAGSPIVLGEKSQTIVGVYDSLPHCFVWDEMTHAFDFHTFRMSIPPRSFILWDLVSPTCWAGVFILSGCSPHFLSIAHQIKLHEEETDTRPRAGPVHLPTSLSVQFFLLDVYVDLYHRIFWGLSQSVNWESRS